MKSFKSWLCTCEFCVVMVKNGEVQTFSRVANLDEAIAWPATFVMVDMCGEKGMEVCNDMHACGAVFFCSFLLCGSTCHRRCLTSCWQGFVGLVAMRTPSQVRGPQWAAWETAWCKTCTFLQMGYWHESLNNSSIVEVWMLLLWYSFHSKHLQVHWSVIMRPLVIFLWLSCINRCAIHGGCSLAWW
jgi:hypothetical protein